MYRPGRAVKTGLLHQLAEFAGVEPVIRRVLEVLGDQPAAVRRQDEGAHAAPIREQSEGSRGLQHGHAQRPGDGGLSTHRQRLQHPADRREAEPQREDDRFLPRAPEAQAPARSRQRPRTVCDPVDEERRGYLSAQRRAPLGILKTENPETL